MAEALDPAFLLEIPFKDRSAFRFYYDQTSTEHLPLKPEYTWDQFAAAGYAPFQENDDYNLAQFDELAGNLIPNYRERVESIPPMLSTFDGRVAEAIHHQIDIGKAAIINTSHPSLASPILVTRSIVEALGPDIRKQIYIVYGLLPTVFKYELLGSPLSPVSVARSLGNTMLTAAITPSNETVDRNVAEWQVVQRRAFKTLFEEVTAKQSADKQGAIVVVCVTGQRKKAGPVLRPDGKLDYLYGKDLWSVGIQDSLLGPQITSTVWMQADAAPTYVQRASDVHTSNRRTCDLASHGDVTFDYETHTQQTKRMVLRRRERNTGAGILHLG